MQEKTEQSPGEFTTREKNQLRATLLSSSEGRLLLTGATLAFIYAFWLAVRSLYSPDDSQFLAVMTATHIIFGRAAGMLFGYRLELGHGTVIPIAIIIETILVLIFYPLFVFSWRHLLTIKWLKNTFERTRKAAEARKGLVQRYGIIGLFVFVWFPFWMTGPVVGCVIGFLLGLRVWLNITVVLAGTYVAIFGWAFLLRQVHDRVASYSSYAPIVLIALLVIIVIVGHLLQRTVQNNKHKN
ncbi:MAG: small multi-drug export protein [Planctomycetota bacterium]|jgi:uncharacterized membrane protein